MILEDQEKPGNIKSLLKKLIYYDHDWLICIDLKRINFYLGNRAVLYFVCVE